ncbi:hypothetical protein BJ684DRAFT_17296, partial [Piptocephalis cylindrospora]
MWPLLRLRDGKLALWSLLPSLLTLALFLTLSLPTQVSAIYEDQKGSLDWQLQGVGLPKETQFLRPTTLSKDNLSESLIVSTDRNILAKLSVADGSILWRRQLDGPIHSVRLIGQDIITLSSPKHLGQSRGTHLSVWNSESGILRQTDILLPYPAYQLLLLDLEPDSLLIVGDTRVEKWSSKTKSIQWSWSIPSKGESEGMIQVKKVDAQESSGQVYITGPVEEGKVAKWAIESVNLSTGTSGSSYVIEGVHDNAILVLGPSETTL